MTWSRALVLYIIDKVCLLSIRFAYASAQLCGCFGLALGWLCICLDSAFVIALPSQGKCRQSWRLILYTNNLCTQCVQTAIDIAVSSVNLLDILNCACALGTHRCYEQRHARANIG